MSCLLKLSKEPKMYQSIKLHCSLLHCRIRTRRIQTYPGVVPPQNAKHVENIWVGSSIAKKKPTRKGEAHSSLLWISQGTPWTSNSAGQPKALALPHIVHARYRIVKVVQPPCPLHSASSGKPMHRLIWPCTWAKG